MVTNYCLMGCCTSGNTSSSHRVLVSYAGKTMPYLNTTTLGALKIVITRSFPEISGPFVLVANDGTPFTEESYPLAYGQASELKVQIKLLEPHKFADAAWTTLSEATFKISNKEGRLLGTGFLVSSQLALASAEVTSATVVKDLKGHFDVIAPFDFSFDPQFVVKMSGACVDGTIQKFDATRIIYGKSIEPGAEGAPVFNAKKDLVGMYVGGSPGVIVNAGWIVRVMTALMPNLGNVEKAAVQEVLNCVRPFEVGSESPSPPAPRPVEGVARVVISDPMDIDLASENSKSEVQFAFSLDLVRDTISLFDGSGYVVGKVTLEHRFVAGASCVLVPDGLVITGPDANSGQNAALLREKKIEDLKTMLFEHEHHTSVFYKGEVVVLSGVNTANIERLPQLTEHWVDAGCLPEKRGCAAALVYEEQIYLIGGVSSEGGSPLASILVGDLQKWSSFSVSLPVGLKGCGALQATDHRKAIIFGGSAAGGDSSQTIYELTLESGKIETKGNFKFAGNMHACQPVYFQKVVMVSSDAGTIYTYKVDREKFQLLQNEATTGV